MKTCSKCKIEKDFNEFYCSKRTKDGFRERCKFCENLYNKIQSENRKNPFYKKRVKKYFNESYFEIIDTEDKAYFLGFICADGCVRYDQNRGVYGVFLKINKKDEHILNDFIKCVNGNISVRKDIIKDTVEIRLTGKKISNDLIKLGVYQNKTFSLKYPNIPPELERHFIRGYFDGDGCIRIKKDKRNGKEIGDMRFVSGSIDILNSINIRMEYLFGTKRNSLYGPKKGNYKFIGWSSMRDIESIYKGFYEDSNFYLNRKKETFEKVINTIKDKIKYRKNKKIIIC